MQIAWISLYEARSFSFCLQHFSFFFWEVWPLFLEVDPATSRTRLGEPGEQMIFLTSQHTAGWETGKWSLCRVPPGSPLLCFLVLGVLELGVLTLWTLCWQISHYSLCCQPVIFGFVTQKTRDGNRYDGMVWLLLHYLSLSNQKHIVRSILNKRFIWLCFLLCHKKCMSQVYTINMSNLSAHQ